MTLQVSQQPTDMVGQTVKSPVLGNVAYAVTQDFGVLGFRPDWYQYSAAHGFPPGYHIGLDIGAPKMTPVFANLPAIVKESGPSEYFRPNPVILETLDDPRTTQNEAGFTEIYGHLWQDAVTSGQTIKPGQLVGYTGEQTVAGTMTPDGSGPHIHFEVYDPKGNAINPLPFLGVNFTPDPNAASPGTGSGGTTTGNQLSFPGVGDLTGVADAIGSLTKTLRTVMAKGLIATVGFILVAMGLYAVTHSGGVGGMVRTTKKYGKTAAMVL